jgi:molecular chaperone GrpE
MMNSENELVTEAGEAVIEGGTGKGSSENDLRTQLDAANARADENYNKFLLAMADFENYKKRMQRDIESIVTSHRRRLLERFLPVIDNLERALQFNGAGDDKLRGGVEQTLRGFESILAAEGVKSIDVKGKPFDPRIAEAIGTLPAKEGVEDDTVLEVAEKGYTIGDEMLRPAKVLVAKKQG